MDTAPHLPAATGSARRVTLMERWGGRLITQAEHVTYLVLGLMLTIALVLTIAGAARLLLAGLADWSGTDAIFRLIDRLLFVLMLVEILHTVGASFRSGTLVCEPFLIVGLIACIRRILVITMKTSQVTQLEHWSSSDAGLFHASMLEFGMLGGLIVVLVGSIYVIRMTDRHSPGALSGVVNAV